jgi:hypothetical protein
MSRKPREWGERTEEWVTMTRPFINQRVDELWILELLRNWGQIRKVKDHGLKIRNSVFELMHDRNDMNTKNDETALRLLNLHSKCR